MSPDELPLRIARRITVDAAGCWRWGGVIKKGTGYGQFMHAGKRDLAHRIVYRLLVGPITDETLDHLCRVRSCVRPSHLEPVSRATNTLRGQTVSADNARKTRCPRGHAYDRIDRRGWRKCTICERERARAYRAAQRTGV